ncbi:TIGR03085 family protein [Microlunatus endophyticus]|uniref:TIGR03085 family protein n=1 Tax=Microlunatus endophyticus TaxID=1716077 RepID=A0A917W160_9ACTN|nr:TIGR03085 family metal-binding protein [Microlunatus endophyticus]GGL54938.1 TIGR03085 family protein [Microlunatus endophyticus]
MTFAKDERVALCDLLVEVGPDAPTLCTGWTTHDLAAHLWIRETDPVGAPGIAVKPLSGLTERRMAETKARWSFPELVTRIRNGPARFSIFALPGVDEPANGTEYFVHHEDVRRAGDQPLGPRDLGPEIEDLMWRRLKLMGRAFFRRAKVGVVLERVPVTAADPDTEPETVRAQTGAPIVTAVGKPSELVLFANGRTSAADVKLVGEQDAVDALLGSDLAL